MSGSKYHNTQLAHPWVRNAQAGNSKLLLIFIAMLAIGIGIYVQSAIKQLPTFEKLILLPKPRVLPATIFSDHQGQRFSSEQLKNQWSILFFGFTNCPDVCPSTLKILTDVKEQVSQAGLWVDYQVIMVSVDPERDTPEKLGAYVPFFDPEFIGITTSIDNTTEFAKSVGVLFIKRESENGDEWYDVDHSASLILINPQGQWAGAITAPHRTDQISSDLIKLAQYNGSVKANSAINSSTVATSATEQSSTAQNATSLVIEKAWIRPAPPNANSLAAYFEIHNTSAQDITIVDSQSTGFAMTMIHDTTVEDGLTRMRHLDKLVIPAGQRVRLEPLGKHMMLMRPHNRLSLGNKTQLTLISDKGQRFSTPIEVREQPE